MSKASNLAGFITSIVPSNNLNLGVATAFSWVGSGLNLTGVGFGTTGSINTTGIITATKFVGSGIGLTNIGDGGLAPITYSPGIAVTNIDLPTNIVLTFNKPIQAGVGTITIRSGSASGTIIESYDVGISTRLSISGGVLTIDPVNNLSVGTTYYVVFPEGAYKDILNSSSSVGISTYYFVTRGYTYSLFTWGLNQYGELGQNNRVSQSSPVQIPGITWSSINAGGAHSLVTKTDGTLWSWGYNGRGQLGQLNRANYSSPVQIPGTTWNIASGGNEHSLATKTDGTLWAWGDNSQSNDQGQLGQNNTTNYSSPVQIPGTTWSSPHACTFDSLVKKTDGTLWAFGGNAYGQLGQNNRVKYSSPVQIPGTTWSSISGSYHILATKTDGTLWAWGRNHRGQLGQNNRTYYSSPVQIPGTTWSSINSCLYHSIGKKTDGTLWGWGNNNDGNLGQNDVTQYSSPVQIPGTTWSSVGGGKGGNYSLATKTDGTLWSWGIGSNGRLGQNATTSSSSPTQIPGTTWSAISGGTNHILATKAE